jgi:hypothetical protein
LASGLAFVTFILTDEGSGNRRRARNEPSRQDGGHDGSGSIYGKKVVRLFPIFSFFGYLKKVVRIPKLFENCRLFRLFAKSRKTSVKTAEFKTPNFVAKIQTAQKTAEFKKPNFVAKIQTAEFTA